MEMLRLEEVGKTFTLHAQGGVRLPVINGVSLSVDAGAALALVGPSGVGKSSLMRMIYGNYSCDQGRIYVRHHGEMADVAAADPRTMLAIRRDTIGYISQFLRVIPRVPAIEVVAEPLRARGTPVDEAHQRAGELLSRLRIPKRLWSLSPVTFSGGEQQRVNIARGFAAPMPVLLLDEPTASLDAANRETVIELIDSARRDGAAIVGIFHDTQVRDRVSTRTCDLAQFQLAA